MYLTYVSTAGVLMRHAVMVGMVLLALATAVAGEPVQRSLTFEDRIEAQRAIEQVYWRHRIWPQNNPAPKPSLEACP